MSTPVRIGKFEVVGELGHGGLGTVYRVRPPRGGPDLALKLMQEEWVTPLERSRFEREFRLARSIDHPNVIRVYDLGEFHGQPYYTMELVEGVQLGQ
ncbi:MAG: protein kinase domain-containing protein, partial [Candidatus Xenobia bacterium]